MTPEEFDSIYGDALAGSESKNEAVKPSSSSPGASGGGVAVSKVKTARAKQIENPTASQADAIDDGESVDPSLTETFPWQGAPPMPAPAPPTPPERVPLYQQAGGLKGLAQMAPPMVAQRAIESGYTNLYQPAVDAVNRGTSAIGNELAFQAGPILNDAELYRKKLMAKLRGE